ncbi:MAG: hypothetical protein M3680_19095, partial [Myxococcota bacterium]|nr:hypothetical protein [Myxococcota bacterium]
LGSVADLEGAEQLALSPDGARLAGWVGAHVNHDAPRGAKLAGRPPRFVAVWDTTSGARLWRAEAPVLDDWRFSDDGVHVVAASVRHDQLRYRAATGSLIRMPADVQYRARWSHSGHRLVMIDGRAASLWAGTPPHPLIAVP